MAKANTASRVRKKVRKTVSEGIVHVHASFNNRRVNRAGTLTGQERRQLRLHDACSRRHGFLGFLGCGKAHRFLLSHA